MSNLLEEALAWLKQHIKLAPVTVEIRETGSNEGALKFIEEFAGKYDTFIQTLNAD